MLSPLDFVLLLQGPNHIDEGGIESLTVSIALGVVASCPKLGNISNLTEILEKVTFKIGSLVCDNLLRKSIFTEEVVIGSLSCSKGFLIWGLNSLCKSRVVVCNDENVNIFACFSMLNSEIVHMD